MARLGYCKLCDGITYRLSSGVTVCPVCDDLARWPIFRPGVYDQDAET